MPALQRAVASDARRGAPGPFTPRRPAFSEARYQRASWVI